jgi:hypothetical protein
MEITTILLIFLGLVAFTTIIIGLMFRSMVVLLQDIRQNGDVTVRWLREIAGNALDEDDEIN